jgi:hypothetical protein
MTFDDTITQVKERFDSLGYDRSVESVHVEHRRRRRQRQLSSLAAAAAVVGVPVVLAPFAKQSAIAGWTSEPHAADPATVAASNAACRPMLSAFLPDVGTPGWSDLRGNALVVAYPTDSAVGVCMQVDKGRGFAAAGAAAVPIDLEPLTGVLSVASVAGLESGGSGVTVVVGRASSEVTRIVVTAPDWTADASRYESYWLAWWPAAPNASDVSVAAYNSAGDLVGTWSPPPTPTEG